MNFIKKAIDRRLSSIFNSRAFKTLKYSAAGAQLGLDVGVVVAVTGLAVASFPLTLAFGAVTGAVVGGVLAFGHFKKGAHPVPGTPY